MWRSPYVLLIIAACFWGGNFVMGRVIVTEIPPFLLSLLRWILAFFVTVPFWGGEFWENRLLLLKRWKMLLFLSITGVVCFNLFLYIAVQYTTSINASLMNAATPIIIVFFSLFLLREKMVWSIIPPILLSFAGVFWIISRGSWTAFTQFSFNLGDLWMLAAVVSWGLYSVGMKKISGEIPVRAMFIAKLIIALIILIPSTVLEWTYRQPEIHLTVGLSAGILYIGIFASVFAFNAWNSAISMIGPARCSGFLNLIPVFSTIFATLFAGESVHFYHLAGAAFILAGVYWMNKQLKIAKTREAAAKS